MTTRQKLTFALVLGLLLAIAGGEAWLLSPESARHAALEAEIRRLESEIDRWSERSTSAQRELENARAAAAAAEAAAPATVNPLLSTRERDAWLARARQLKQLFASRPDQAIPELRLLTDRDWLRLAKDARFDSGEQIKKALAQARTQAKGHFVAKLDAALRAYTKQPGGQLPAAISELIPFMETPPDPQMLNRYHMTRSGSAVGRATDWAIEEKTLIDRENDAHFHVQATGGYGANSGLGSELLAPLERAQHAYEQVHGHDAEHPADLVPYFNPPLDVTGQQRFAELIQKMQLAKKAQDAGSRPK